MRLLHVGMSHSVHTARWLNMLNDLGWEQHLFPTHDRPQSADLRNVTLYHLEPCLLPEPEPSLRVEHLRPWIDEPRRPQLEWLSQGIDRAGVLARLIRQLQPDIVHSHQLQYGAYLTLDARSRLNAPFPLWLATSWGSDINWFSREPEHLAQIRAVLGACDYFSSECTRDVLRARSFGFRGETLAVLPVTGGLDLDQIATHRQAGPTSARRTVTLSGRSIWVYRGLVGVRALERNADLLRDYTVVITLASEDVRAAAEAMCSKHGIALEILPHVPHDEMLRLRGRSRVSIALSMTDGINTSFLEAIAMGSFPVQSNTGCASEWAEHGEGALFVDPEDEAEVAAAIRRALTDDGLVDRAAEINAQVVAEKLDQARIRPRVVEQYERIRAGHRAV